MSDEDLDTIRRQVEDLYRGAMRAADLAWPDGNAPDAVTEALHKLHEAREHLAFADSSDEASRSLSIAAVAARAAGSVHEAADLVSS